MPNASRLQQRLRLFDAVTIVAGSMIGSAIFFALSIMAQWVQTPGILIGLWVFAGVFTILGTLAFGELAGMFPHAGGQYVYLREAYSAFWGFLFGWTQFVVVQTGFNAAVAIAFAKYLGSLVPVLGEDHVLLVIPLAQRLPSVVRAAMPEWLHFFTINSAQCVACGVIAVLTAVNIRGVREGALVQNLFTVLKLVALAALIAAGLMRSSDWAHFVPLWEPVAGPAVSWKPGEGALQTAFLAGLAVALSKALFAYDAWNTVTFVAEEVHDSERTLPRAMLLGSLLVTGVYVLANVAYLAVLPIAEIAAVPENRVAQQVAEKLFGAVGSTLVIVAILISTFGCVNGMILGGARVNYAMAREGLFFRACSKLHPRNGTPAVALVYQGAWSMLLALTGSYSALLTYTTFASVFFGGLTVAAVFWLRWRQPYRPRPYRCWGYPITPAAYLVICLAFLVYVIQGAPRETGFGMLLILSGVPFYWWWRGKRGLPAG